MMADLVTHKINNHIIRPIVKKGGNHKKAKPIKGAELFQLYGNSYICARKKSGKTLLIYHLIEKTCTKNTTIIFFVSTFYKDDGYKNIEKLCDKMNIPIIVHTSLMDDEVKGLDVLGETVKHIKGPDDEYIEAKEKIQQPPKPVIHGGMFDTDDNDVQQEEIKEAKRKSRSKWLVPEYLFIFDDISQEIKRSESLVSLLKDSRHLKAKVFVSSQSWTDVPKNGRGQFDYYILFRGIPEEKLEDIYDESALSTIPFKEFNQIYHDATKVNGNIRHNFLYINKDEEEFRLNLNEVIETTYDLTERK